MTAQSNTRGDANPAMSDRATQIDVRSTTSTLEQSRSSSTAMAVMARKLRFATSRRSAIYQTVGLRPRAVDRIFVGLAIALVTLVFVVPNVASVAYHGFVASDRYESETRFTVRTSTPMTKSDQLADLSGLPSAEIVQNSQIVTNFIESPALLAIVVEQGDFVERYSDPDIDYVSRLQANSTPEERLDYWKDMVGVTIDPTSGIITVDVRAFSAENAQAIAKIIVAQSEKLINDLNDRIWRDVNASAKDQVKSARDELVRIRDQLQAEQNRSGMLTVASSAEELSKLVVGVQSELINQESRYNASLATVSKNAPQMRVLERQIASKKQQLIALQQRVASESPDSSRTLADASLTFSELDFERSVAEQQLKASINASEQLQYASQQQMMYLDPFLSPTLPVAAEYPRRALWIGLVFLASLVATTLAIGILSLVRRRFD